MAIIWGYISVVNNILRGNSLSASCLRANYLGANFRASNFRGAIIPGAIIQGAIVRGSIIRGAMVLFPRRSHLQKFRKTLVVIKISKNLQKMKYMTITDVKKLILILLKCFNSVLLKNEHFKRSRTPDSGCVVLLKCALFYD